MDQPTEEQLKNMSPEELKKFQKKNCLFCHIISGKVASKKVYEDEVCLAVLDINPANPGHVILLPKEHYSIIPMMPDEHFSQMMVVARRLSTAILRSVGAEGINMFMANGAVAGQKSPHAMVHLIPRKEGDGITAFDLPKNEIDPADQKKLQKLIAFKLSGILGVAPPKIEDVEEGADKKLPEGSTPEGPAQNLSQNLSQTPAPEADRDGVDEKKEDRSSEKGSAQKKSADSSEETKKETLDKISKLFR